MGIRTSFVGPCLVVTTLLALVTTSESWADPPVIEMEKGQITSQSTNKKQVARTKPLSGVVKQTVKIPRPHLQHIEPGAVPFSFDLAGTQQRLHAAVRDDSAASSTCDELPSSSTFSNTEKPLAGKSLIDSEKFDSGARQNERPEAPAQNFEAIENAYSGRKFVGKTIVLRMTDFRIEPNVYALRTANYYVQRGATVKLLLDRLSVKLANKHISEGVEINNKILGLKDLLQNFIQRGGRVVVSKMWADRFDVTAANCAAGVEFVSEDEMNDEILESQGALVEF